MLHWHQTLYNKIAKNRQTLAVSASSVSGNLLCTLTSGWNTYKGTPLYPYQRMEYIQRNYFVPLPTDGIHTTELLCTLTSGWNTYNGTPLYPYQRMEYIQRNSFAPLPMDGIHTTELVLTYPCQINCIKRCILIPIFYNVCAFKVISIHKVTR